MPCEKCRVQFNVFKRKRSCGDCKRFYCQNCLSTNAKKHSLCERCLLFSRRPLQRADLIQLRTKDLIFYLQSKHVSTAGCVEKEDLIDLVIQCIERMDSNQSTSSGSSKSSSKNTTPQHRPSNATSTSTAGVGVGGAGVGGAGAGRRPSDNANSFDNIKQTCQNFFSSLSENISDSFANLESRACSKTRTSNVGETNITEQPRVATREIPTYASAGRQQSNATSHAGTESPARSTSATSITLQQQTIQTPTEANTVANIVTAESTSDPNDPNISTQPEVPTMGECECSDDELIATFSTRTRSPKSTTDMPFSNDEADQATTCGPSTSASTSKPSSQYSKMEIYINDEEESSHSSFEELGAIGGISDDSKTTTDTTSNNTDQWQMLDLKQETTSNQTVEIPLEDGSSIVQPRPSQLTSSKPPPQPSAPPPVRVKKVTRRRSESYLNRRRPQYSVDDDEDEAAVHSSSVRNPSYIRIEEETQTSSATSNNTKRCCMRCGKNKVNIRQQVEKMRQHLQSSQMSEADIKEELTEFLVYLEQRTKSVEYSDSDAGASTPSISRQAVVGEATLPEREYTLPDEVYSYVADMESSTSLFEKDSRFINLDSYDSIKQLEHLSVKQLKEVLMLHRVDFKGCCEKQELLERVERLWKNLKSTPAVEKLPTDELCKICMDAPIECVILECGHMATCTNCGKVLSECPICRQYIVRVVRFFRA